MAETHLCKLRVILRSRVLRGDDLVKALFMEGVRMQHRLRRAVAAADRVPLDRVLGHLGCGGECAVTLPLTCRVVSWLPSRLGGGTRYVG